MPEGADEISPNIDGTAAGAAPSGPGPQPQGMSGGGPILNAIARRMRGPQVSAPGPGDQASSMTMLLQIIGLMHQALPGLMPGSPVHKDVLKALSALSKHAPEGAPGAGVQQTQLQDLLKNVVKNALLQKIMGQQQPGQGGPPGAGGGGPPGGGGIPGAMSPAPMPSTPLPGA